MHLTYLQIKMFENRGNTLSLSIETTIKVPFMFLDIKKLKER